MRELDEMLSYLIDNVDGAQLALIADSDGLLIEQYPANGKDLSEVTVQWTKVMTVIEAASKTVNGGHTKDLMISSEKMLAYARTLNESLFILVVMNSSGNFGLAKLYCKKIEKQILEIF